jgi:capsular polysaccharide biosynthesis protein
VSFEKVYVNQGLKFQIDSLSWLGFDESRILPASEYPWLQAKKIFSAKYPDSFYTLSGEVVLQIRKTLLKNCPFEKEQGNNGVPRRVYISRNDCQTRKVENEEEIAEILASKGFERVMLRELGMAQQISLFYSAEYVIGPHGAGMANLTFCNPGCKVVELFPETYKIDLYKKISDAVGADYKSLGGHKMSSMDNYWRDQHSDFFVDPGPLAALVDD